MIQFSLKQNLPLALEINALGLRHFVYQNGQNVDELLILVIDLMN